jgi:putative glutamine amidotransferase
MHVPRIALTPYKKLRDYQQALRLAGAEPVVVDMAVESAAALLARVDGVLLPGGGDIDPVRYGEPRHATFDPAEAGRDEYELELASLALDADIPLLAICRGVQVLNVARGGTLIQDIPDRLPGAGRHRIAEPADAIAHAAHVVPGSRLERLLGARLDAGTCMVNSRHHQAASTIGDGLVVTATAPDGVVEALEAPAQRFCVGVQWHPENFHRTGEFSALFDGFVTACSSRR